MDRRDAIRIGIGLTAGAVGTVLSGCADRSNPDKTRTPASTAESPEQTGTGSDPRVLVAYFSRAGENYHYGGRKDLDVGNTEVVSTMIADRIPCELHRIDAAQPYSHSYDATVDRNKREQEADARPTMADPAPSIDQYDVILLGSGIWNVRPPMIMNTFTESYDFAGKTIHPFVTYAVSGLGSTMEVYRDSCRGGRVERGLAVRGEEVRRSAADVDAWLRSIDLLGA